MAKPIKSKGLGRGLSALMADVNLDRPIDATPPSPDQLIPIEEIAPNPDQPRKSFEATALEELSASIKQRGILQPLIVRRRGNGSIRYEIVAGERRWRAAQLAQMHEVPAIVRELDDTEVLEIAIIENIQRENLNPVEEARGYRQLIDAFGHTQEQLSKSLGKSRSHIANFMRLLSLPEEVLEHLSSGRLSAGHARALIPSPNASELARQVISRGLSVRETERLVKRGADPANAAGGAPRRSTPEKDSDTRAIEQDLTANLRMPVAIIHKDIDGAGQLTIRYRDLDQLDTLCRMLSASLPDDSI